jgi:hypothetical protein
MKREKMVELLALLNPATAKVLSLSGVTDEMLEIALFHEACHIDAQRRLATIRKEQTNDTQQ